MPVFTVMADNAEDEPEQLHRQASDADVTVTLTRAVLDDITLRKTTFPAALASGQIGVAGRADKLIELLSMLDTFTPAFPVVEPRPAR